MRFLRVSVALTIELGHLLNRYPQMQFVFDRRHKSLSV
jgi:hypothetical protein